MNTDEFKEISFNQYTYQILPVSQNLQLSFDLVDSKISNTDELIAKKNELFASALKIISVFSYARTNLIHKIEAELGDFYLIRLGAERDLNRTRRDFVEEKIDNWPTIFIAINNDPNAQKIAIQVNRQVFSKTQTVAEVLQSNLNGILSSYGLRVYIKPNFEKSQFWELVEKYEGKIWQVDFELISPNMSRISENLQLDLRSLSKSTNTRTTHLQLNADEKSSLTLSQEDKFVDSLVEYSSEGGGSISIRARGVKKKIQTTGSVTESSVKELDIQVSKPEQLLEVFKSLLS